MLAYVFDLLIFISLCYLSTDL